METVRSRIEGLEGEEIVEAFARAVDELTQRVDERLAGIESRLDDLLERVSWLEGSTAAADSVFASRLDEVTRLAEEFCRIAGQALP